MDDLLRQRHDLTPQLPLDWAAYETTPPDRDLDVAGDSALCTEAPDVVR